MSTGVNNHSKSGVSLIIVLGLLVVLTILAVAFSRAMREGRLMSRSYADQVRAESLIPVAFAHAMEDIDADMQGWTYPSADAMSSSNPPGDACNLLTGEAVTFIPRALWHDATVADSFCRWTNIVTEGGSRTNGRFAYLVVNCSGLVDANIIGQPDSPVSNLDVSPLPDFGTNDLDLFYSDRTNHIRYETIEELAKLNHGVTDPVSNLFIYSYDPDRDQYFTNRNELGSRGIILDGKRIIDCPGLVTSNDFAEAGVSNASTAYWNLINYLDPDCRPDNTNSPEPCLDPGGTEPVPLINEISLTLIDPVTTSYCFQVELFYPFVTREPVQTDTMSLYMEVSITNQTTLVTDQTIGPMEFAIPERRFLVYTSQTFTVSNNGAVCYVDTDHRVGFLASVRTDTGMVVDQAPGKEPYSFDSTNGISVDDPRCNGDPSLWIPASSTLNGMNINCNPWGPTGQGLPIFFANGPMQSIGEIGHIFTGVPWETIDLLSTNGGRLIDTLTTRVHEGSTHGLININTRQRDVLATVFSGATIGVTNTDISTNRFLDNTELDALVSSFPTPLTMDSFEDYLSDMGNVAWSPDGIHTNKELKEDVFRGTLDLITFRQNLFTVILAAQAFGPDGRTPVAERRAVAVVYRDAYTGRHFTRFMKWISK